MIADTIVAVIAITNIANLSRIKRTFNCALMLHEFTQSFDLMKIINLPILITLQITLNVAAWKRNCLLLRKSPND